MIEEETGGCCIPAEDLGNKEWYSWINLMGSPYYEFHAIGEVYLPGYPETMPRLALKNPQGNNPEILLLELVFQRKPETSSRAFAWKAVRYDEAVHDRTYVQVQVHYEGTIIANIPVEQVR